MSSPSTPYQTLKSKLPVQRVPKEYKITSIIDHNEEIREIVLHPHNNPAQMFRFRSGQFVMLHVPSQDTSVPILRAYSIASSENTPQELHLLFKLIPNGKASLFVWSLKGSEVLTFTGPFGRMFFPEPPPSQMIFLCTSTGIAPYFSFLKSKAALYKEVHYKLLIGLRNEKDLFYTKELEELSFLIPNFKYEIVLSKPSERWDGKTGHVQAHLGSLVTPETGRFLESTQFFLCGKNVMIEEAKAILTAQHSIQKEMIHAEAFD